MQVLEESIKPDLEKLRSDKTEFQEWQLAVSKAEQLEHIVAAHRYWDFRQSGAECKEQADRTTEILANAEETQENMKVRKLHDGRLHACNCAEHDAHALRCLAHNHCAGTRSASASVQKEIKAAEKRIKELKAEQEAESSEQMGKLTKAADDAGIKLAKRKAAVEAAQEDLQVSGSIAVPLVLSSMRLIGPSYAAKRQDRLNTTQTVLSIAIVCLSCATMPQLSCTGIYVAPG